MIALENHSQGIIVSVKGCGNTFWHRSHERSCLAPARQSKRERPPILERSPLLLRLAGARRRRCQDSLAHPGARRNGVAGEHAGALKVRASKVRFSHACSRIRQNSDRVADRPNSGEFGYRRDFTAFHTLEALALKVQVTLLSGATSRQKRFLVAGLALAEIAKRLQMKLEVVS